VVSERLSKATNGVVMSKVVVALDNWEGNREAGRRAQAGLGWGAGG